MRVREGLVGTAVAHLEAFLLEPEEAGARPGTDPRAEPAAPAIALAPPPAAAERPVIAVLGLARRCGSTLVARALAAELAGRDPGGAAAVGADRRTAALPLAAPGARRLARLLTDVPGASTTAAGRLCLVHGADEAPLADTTRGLAPLVLDCGHRSVAGAEAGVCDGVVLVSAPGVEPSLAELADECLRRTGARVLRVRNVCRAGSAREPATGGHGDRDAGAGGRGGGDGQELRLPFSRAGARLALAGYPPGGELGRAAAELADRCEGLA